MNKIASFVKALRLKQITIALLAGVVLLLNTACSGSAQAKMPTAVDNDPHPVNQNQPYTGGMNNYDDTPPGQIPSEKAKSLIDNAQRNINADEPRNAKLYKNPGYAAERTADELGDTLKERAKNAQESAKGIVDRGTTNLKDNVRDAVDDATYKSKQAAKDLTNKAQDTVDAAKDAID
ncbi:MAG: hypothetical protein MUC48_07370 [Leptolyngbya sp. Prado105]|nr:hypothetical protein [Leptolyngbya sp. Prado105]